MIACLPPYSHISDYMIKELHWLPILARVRYKVLLLVAKSLHRAIYVSSCLNRYLLPPLGRCALVIAVIFLYLGPELLYPRTGHLWLWVLHFGMILLRHSRV